MEKVYGIIYKTTCLVNGKIYIGQTICLNRKSYLGSGRSISLAIKKYGKQYFIREILEECYSQVELDIYEELYIEQYNSRDRNIGYNIAKGSVLGAIGEANHMKLPEIRKKVSESVKGENHPNFGKKHSLETRIKMSISRKKRGPISDETRKKISESKKNISDETRKKISESVKISLNRPGVKDKISKAAKNRKMSDETKNKMSISLSKKPICQYTKKGEYVSEYISASYAYRITGINNNSILKCCNGKRKSAGKYVWKYKID